MSNISVFNFDAYAVRVVNGANGAPWFVAADVCLALDLPDTHKAIGRLDDDEKDRNSIPTPGGNQSMSTVNESGLYSLILGSRKAEAKRFKKWVTSEVLPSIRKHGAFIDPNISLKSADELVAGLESRFGPMFGSQPAAVAPVSVVPSALCDMVDRGTLSKRGAVRRFDAWLIAQNPAMAAALSRPARAPAAPSLQMELLPKPVTAPAPAKKHLKITVRSPLALGFDDGIQLVLTEVAQYVGGGYETLTTVMVSRCLLTEALAPTANGKAFISSKSARGNHWRVAALLRHLSA